MSEELERLALANPQSYHAQPQPNASESALWGSAQTNPNPPTGETPMQTQPQTRPRTVSELFPSRWLKASDLKAPVVVTIAACEWVEVYDRQSRTTVEKLALSFTYDKPNGETVRLQKRLLLNKTQALSIAEITGTEVFAEWPGATVQLVVGRAQNGKPTIAVTAAPERL